MGNDPQSMIINQLNVNEIEVFIVITEILAWELTRFYETSNNEHILTKENSTSEQPFYTAELLGNLTIFEE